MIEIKFVGGKYIGYVNGKEVVKSVNKYYVQRKIGTMPTPEFVESTPSSSTEFDINQRFGFVTDLCTMVASGATPSAVITGEGGLGKTYTVIQEIGRAHV